MEIIPLAVEWKPDLSLGDRVKPLEIPWELIQREAQDQVTYLLILKLNRKRNLDIGRKRKPANLPGRVLCLRGFGHEKSGPKGSKATAACGKINSGTSIT